MVVAKSPQFVLGKKTNPQLFFRSSCPHQKLSKHSDMTELLIVYSCLFHRILRRSLTIIFSQREGSSHLASIKAHSLFNPILSNCCSILAQEGQESELECIDIKSWRKMWYSLPSRLALPQTSLARCKSLGGSLLHKTKPCEQKHPLLSSLIMSNILCFNLGVPCWSTKGSARSSWCLGTSVCNQFKI